MNPDFVMGVLQETIRVTLVVGAPVVLASMVVGLSVSVLQAATQIQEMTLVFVPKVLAAVSALLLGGAFMLDHMARFTRMMFDMASRSGGM